MVLASSSTLRSRLGPDQRLQLDPGDQHVLERLRQRHLGLRVPGQGLLGGLDVLVERALGAAVRRSTRAAAAAASSPGRGSETCRPTCSSSAWSTSRPPRSGSPASASTANPVWVAPTTATSNVPAPRSYTASAWPGASCWPGKDAKCAAAATGSGTSTRLEPMPGEAGGGEQDVAAHRAPLRGVGQPDLVGLRAAELADGLVADPAQHRGQRLGDRHDHVAEQQRALVDPALRVRLEPGGVERARRSASRPTTRLPSSAAKSEQYVTNQARQVEQTPLPTRSSPPHTPPRSWRRPPRSWTASRTGARSPPPANGSSTNSGASWRWPRKCPARRPSAGSPGRRQEGVVLRRGGPIVARTPSPTNARMITFCSTQCSLNAAVRSPSGSQTKFVCALGLVAQPEQCVTNPVRVGHRVFVLRSSCRPPGRHAPRPGRPG